MPTRPLAFTLRQVLLVDAAACTTMGAVMAAAAGPVSNLTDIPETLLLYAGVALFPVALFIATVAARAPVNTIAARIVIAGNVLWIAASLALFGLIAPNALGAVLIVGQALAVAVLVLLEHTGLRAVHRPAAQVA